MGAHALTLSPLSAYLCVWQVAMVLLFALCTTLPLHLLPSLLGAGYEAKQLGFAARYSMFMDTHVMMAIGFGFLYTLLRRYAWSGVSLNFLLIGLCLQWALLTQGFWENVRGRVSGALSSSAFPPVPVSLETLIDADYTVAAILISFGSTLGRLSPSQAVFMAFCEVIFATANVSIARALGVTDPGGSMLIHIFGASFGLAFSAALGDLATKGTGIGEQKLGTSRHNGTFAMIGTLFLFCYWPSFNAALLDGDAQQRAAIMTTLSICASVVTAFGLSRAIHRGTHFDMEHVQNATLAGGVVMGAACDMVINPGVALAMGVVAGAVSTVGFSYLTPLVKTAGLTDTVGILDLHLLPGLIGGVASSIAAAVIVAPAWPDAAVALYFPHRGARSAVQQGAFQMAVTVISLVFAALTGALVGAAARSSPAAFEPIVNEFYEDGALWNVPFDEGEENPELEAVVAAKLAGAAPATPPVPGGAAPIDLVLRSDHVHGVSANEHWRLPAAGKETSVHGGDSGRRSANERWIDSSVRGGSAFPTPQAIGARPITPQAAETAAVEAGAAASVAPK